MALAQATEWRINTFNAKGLATAASAFAQADHLDSQLFMVLARATELHISTFQSHGLAYAAFAFA